MIPQGWEVKELDEICHVEMGQSPKSSFESGEGLPIRGSLEIGFEFTYDSKADRRSRCII